MHAHRKMAITSSFLGIFNFLNRWDEVRARACCSLVARSDLIHVGRLPSGPPARCSATARYLSVLPPCASSSTWPRLACESTTRPSPCCAMVVCASHCFFSLCAGLLRLQQLFRHVGHPVRTQPQLHQPLEEDMEGTFTLLPSSVAAALPTTLTPLTT